MRIMTAVRIRRDDANRTAEIIDARVAEVPMELVAGRAMQGLRDARIGEDRARLESVLAQMVEHGQAII